MNVSSRCFSRRLAACVLLTLGIVGVSQAALPTYGLGQAFPQASNRSMSALWRVYVFQRDGVRYVQINDSQGVVRAAFATANGVFLALPMGTDANRVVVPSDASVTSNGFESRMSTCGGACSGNRIITSPRVGHIEAPSTSSSLPKKDVQEDICGGACSGNGIITSPSVGHMGTPSTPSSLSSKDVQEEMCGEACNTNQIVSTTRSSMVQTVTPVMPDTGSVIYEDATLQIRVTEDTQGHQVWRVIALPSAGK